MDDRTDAVIRVGDGRGFLVDFRRSRLVLTAAHCLPTLPTSAHPYAHLEERTYANLLGPLDDETATVWAELLFVDPIADVAVLGTPDNQELSAESDAYDAVVDERPAFRCGAIDNDSAGFVLSLDGVWMPCSVRPANNWRGRLSVMGASTPCGTSGSPIVRADGRAVGIVSSEGAHPRLALDLPGWLLTELLSN